MRRGGRTAPVTLNERGVALHGSELCIPTPLRRDPLFQGLDSLNIKPLDTDYSYSRGDT